MSRQLEVYRKLLSEKAATALGLPGVLALEVATRTRNGRATQEPAIVITVERKLVPEVLARSEDLRGLFGADKVDVVQATPLKALFATPEKYGVDAQTLDDLEVRLGSPFGAEAIGLHTRRRRASARPHITYRPPKGVKLQPLNGKIKLTCHSGPDAGWKELKPFLLETRRELIIGMFELTGPHIGDLLADQLGGHISVFKLTMDKKLDIGSGMKEFDRTEDAHVHMFERAFGTSFEHANAFTKHNGGTFYSDYHIKLAVRDRRAFWLSSGSWQSSNQPNLDPLGADREDPRLRICNREWHIIGFNPDLSDVWAKFLEGDLETALTAQRAGLITVGSAVASPVVFSAEPPVEFPYEEFFAPVDLEVTAGQDAFVMPLLTPDNYVEAATKLVEEAKDALLVQNQSLSFLSNEADQDARYTAFTGVLARQSKALRNFKFIVRDPAEFGNSAAEALKIYEAKGFDPDKIRFQPHCHNKGIIADGERMLVGSHNITNAGTTMNRDASLLVHHKGVAGYFAKIFAHDWRVADRLARHLAPAPRMVLALPGELPPAGTRAYRLWDLLDDD